MQEQSKSPYQQAVECYEDFICSFEQDFGIKLEKAFELSFPDLFIETHPRIGTHYTESGGVYHSLSDDLAGFLGGAAQEIPEVFHMVREICARNTFQGKPLPFSFRTVAYSIICGTFPAASRRGAPSSNGFGKRWIIYSGANFLRDAFDLPLTRNEVSAEISACDAIVEALDTSGVAIKYELVRDWCTSAKYADLRRRADFFSDYFKDLALNEWGVLSGTPTFGPMWEYVRMNKRD